MVRSGPCRPRRSRTRAWNGHGELLVGEDALLAKLPELFDLLAGFPARGPLGRCCGGLLQHLLVQFLVVMLVARHHHDQASVVAVSVLAAREGSASRSVWTY